MRVTLWIVLAVLAVSALPCVTGCGGGGGGSTQAVPLTEAIVYMSQQPAAEMRRAPAPWVWLMTADGAARMALVDAAAPESGICQGMLSPDGSRLLFVTTHNNPDNGVFRYDLATGRITLLYTGDFPSQPTYSPNGRTILFCEGPSLESVCTMNADGTNVRVLLPTPGENSCYDAQYNKEGTRIVFQYGGSAICVMQADGTRLQTLEDTGENAHPTFLPDGRILYSHAPEKEAAYNIWIMNGDGTQKRHLINTPDASEFYASSNADGSKIAYCIGDRWDGEIYVADFDGTNLGTPVNITAAIDEPCWRPQFGKVRTDLLSTLFQ